jgi:hypothetical protein
VEYFPLRSQRYTTYDGRPDSPRFVYIPKKLKTKPKPKTKNEGQNADKTEESSLSGEIDRTNTV